MIAIFRQIFLNLQYIPNRKLITALIEKVILISLMHTLPSLYFLEHYQLNRNNKYPHLVGKSFTNAVTRIHPFVLYLNRMLNIHLRSISREQIIL